MKLNYRKQTKKENFMENKIKSTVTVLLLATVLFVVVTHAIPMGKCPVIGLAPVEAVQR